jgi:hypothetical protein
MTTPMKRQNQNSQHIGKAMQRIQRLDRNHQKRFQAGFGLTEVVLSVAAGSLLITGGAVAMRTVSSSMNASSQVTGLRGSATTGLRLLRAETQRSLHLMVNGGQAQQDQSFTDLNNPEYSEALQECQSISSDQQEVFNPLMGMQMAELQTPIIYGLGLGTSGKNYALLRCGPALSGDGRYETEDVILSKILDGIGVTPCPDSNCPPVTDLREVVAGMDNSLNQDNQSKVRSFPEPAFAIETDQVRKLLKLKDPTDQSDTIEFSFLQPPGGRRDLRVDLNFTAYARADKINRTDSTSTINLEETGLSGCDDESGCTFFGIPVNSDTVQLIVDGSGSMSSCIAWGSTYGETRRTYYDGSRYFRTRQACLMTRMESLQSELRALLASLSPTTVLSLQSFSSPGYQNHRQWKEGEMVQLTDSNRESALDFVNSLSNGKVTSWGGTRPWFALDKAFSNADANTVFFMTDGDPNYDRNGGSWSSYDYQPTANAYMAMNEERDPSLSVNTVSVGQGSPWLELLSNGASGTYKVIN